MNQTEFYELLAHQGFPEPILEEYPANGSLDTHTHNFAETFLQQGCSWCSYLTPF